MAAPLLLAETANLKASMDDVRSDTLVVTFAPMGHHTHAVPIWGQPIIECLEASGLGIVCKSDCWFPEEDMRLVSDVITKSFSTVHKKVLLYGFSMGGYAALKYSSLLNADCVVSLSPQYSINPKDVRGIDERLIVHYNKSLNGDMSIKSQNLRGRLFLIYDNFHCQDKWNAEQIALQCSPQSSVFMMRLPYVGHETIDVFSGRQLGTNLLKLALAGDDTNFRIFKNLARRQSQRR